MKKTLTPQQIKEAYLDDEAATLTSAAKKLGVSRLFFIRKKSEYGIPSKPWTRCLTMGSKTKWPQLSDKSWLMEQLKTKSYQQIADELGTTRGNISDRVRRFGIQKKISEAISEGIKKVYPDGRRGPLAANWQGGRRRSNHGARSDGKLKEYIYLHRPNHPNCTKDGYVMEHRLVMEESVGRFLRWDEVVHHKNGDTLDNRIDNLQLCTRGEHTTEHYEAAAREVEALKRVEELETELARYKERFGEI